MKKNYDFEKDGFFTLEPRTKPKKWSTKIKVYLFNLIFMPIVKVKLKDD